MENDVGQVEILNPGLRKAATLTTPDLRFCEQILKNIEENKKFSASKLFFFSFWKRIYNYKNFIMFLKNF